MKLKNEKGFTLVEVLVVIAIIGIIAVIAVPNLYKHTVKAELVKIKSEIRSIQFAVDSFYIENNRMPTENEWFNVMKENIDSDIHKYEDYGQLVYHMKSKYNYKFEFIENDKHTNKIDNIKVGVFKIDQRIVNLIKNDDFEFQLKSILNLDEKNMKDEFFKKYNSVISQDGTLWLKIEPCK